MMQYNDRNRRLLQWAVPITLIVGLILAISSLVTDYDIKSGLKYANPSPAQKALAKQIVAEHKDAVIDPATGYAFIPRNRIILREGLIKFVMNGKTLILKKSIGNRVKEANDYCEKEKKVHIIIYSTLRSNLQSEKASSKRKGIFKRIFGSRAALGNANSAHLTGQVFDVLNFKASHECLTKFGFNGGWEGVPNDPHHYYDPNLDIIPVLSGAKAKLRASRNYLWCLSNGGCRRNNITGGGGGGKGWVSRAVSGAKEKYKKWRKKK